MSKLIKQQGGNFMYLTVTPSAAAKIKKAQDQTANQVLLLDFDDGVGAFSRVGSCTLASVFRVLLADDRLDLHDYDQDLASNIGNFKIKGYSKMYMDQQMKLDLNPKNQMLRLTGANAGELTAALMLEAISPESV
ncbi:hypothetical protein FC89_GL002017 [Liquorilactobacillus ghanensis DSM 18630]|uniref:Core domain-containing protein n=2 Tax=Liquorilactobacillus ghanensis TaxID=399370 RepID=A0A0R1VYJ0_9LACO|nr:hypothetical protein FC89_GL002017 [Liquorilactobacillus ghanensis DSM 18630]